MANITNNINKKHKRIDFMTIADWFVKIVVYLAIFVTSAYGQRQLLISVQENVSIVLTGVFTLVAVYIIFRPSK